MSNFEEEDQVMRVDRVEDALDRVMGGDEATAGGAKERKQGMVHIQFQ